MGDWQLDPYHTQVEFSVKHLGMIGGELIEQPEAAQTAGGGEAS